jgi:hypothetical protein
LHLPPNREHAPVGSSEEAQRPRSRHHKAKGKQEGPGPGKELIAKGEYEMGLFNIGQVNTSFIVGISIT